MNGNIFPDDFLEQLGKIVSQEKPETNFFDVGGCGYLENPTSDLMALFMGGDEEVKPWLLLALLKILNEVTDNIDLSSLRIAREVCCENGERIDIVVSHDEFIIGIENKVKSVINNPFDAYEKQLNEYVDNNQRVYKCIIKPLSNSSSVNNNWKMITYTELVNVAFSCLDKDIVDESSNKWMFFYKEFLSHLSTLSEGEMSNLLNDEQISFVTDNFDKLIKAKNLLDSFENAVYLEGHDILSKILPDSRITKSVNNWKEDYKALHFMPSEWGESYMTLVYHPQKNDGGIEFYVNAIISRSQYDDIESLKNEVRNNSKKGDFIPTASSEDSEITITNNGNYLTLSFWGPSKDKEGAMTLLHDMTVWVNEKIKPVL
ncbi:PD-(D/E)XK nuclease family protein [Pectobacterium polaris]|uniref:PD-(D/E)XK nuclease family protein n=1 Tax=Pectobacterium polaris TaxID=2042057 RepID=UPI0024070299|nr:PD-(D/E)XK nuclease family protein [Pectobacterium polaris]MDG0801438.1 PD-(D/E)XK nuclease family protein [Pectobacterium polaris]